jgi:hypothetical protein
MKKIFLLSILFLTVYSINAQPVKNVYDSQPYRNTTLLSSLITPENQIDNLLVYPNPVADVLKISFRSEQKSHAVISIFNNIGKQVYSQDYSVEQGINIISVDINNKSIEPGIYFVQCMVEKEVYTRKLIVK